MNDNKEIHINEKTCTCCDKKWDSNKIILIEEESYNDKWWKPFTYTDYYKITYRLICKTCNIYTTFKKFIKRKDFKPDCRMENKIG